ncbi:FecR iron transport regulator family protein [Stenotrophomonas maltophilia]|nr:FecR iron transport regulator family protein [Stenotrophomonas maltophilia]
MSQETIAREAARWWLDAHDGDRDENAFEQWCRADPRHAAQYLHLQELWQAGAATPSLQRQQQRRQRRRLREAGIAVLLLCALGLYSRHASPPVAQVLRTAAGEIREETLPDGSHVLLSPGSEVKVRIDGQRRQLQLQRGQAWFQVAADADRPFQVHTPQGTVTALGTAFDLAVQGNSSVVTVTEHRVRVDSGNVSMLATTASSCASMGRQQPMQQRLPPEHWPGASGACTGSRPRWPTSRRAWTAGMAGIRGSSASSCASSRSPCSAVPTVQPAIATSWPRNCRCACCA